MSAEEQSVQRRAGVRAFSPRRRVIWSVIAVLLALFTVWPIVYSYLPISTQSVNAHALTCSSSTCTIVITNSQFGTTNPFYIAQGTTVTWVNHDPTQHTSSSDSGDAITWDSSIINPGRSFSFTFAKTGTFPYHCNVHPMNGQIIVVPKS